jgi:hypothetical protein
MQTCGLQVSQAQSDSRHTRQSLCAFLPVVPRIAQCKKLGKRTTLHPLDTADHGFRTLKKTRKSEEAVFVEMARVVHEWASSLT